MSKLLDEYRHNQQVLKEQKEVEGLAVFAETGKKKRLFS